MRPMSWVAILLGVAAALVLPGAAGAQGAPPAAAEVGANVLVTLSFGRVDEASAVTKRVYKLVASDGGPSARMLMGWRMPLPTAQAKTEEGTEPPMTSYVYQNVGVTADLDVKVLGGGRLLLTGQIESSGTREPKNLLEPGGKTLPVIGTFQQALHIVLQEGKPLRVAEVPDPEGGRLFCEIEAQVLR